MKNSNIGIINALIRITCGLTFLTWAAAKYSKKPWCNSYLVVIMLSAMKVAEGIVRYCPITDLIKNGQNQMNQSFQMNKNQQNQMGQNEKKQDDGNSTKNNANEIDIMNEIKNFQQNLDD